MNKEQKKKYVVGYFGKDQTALYSREAWSDSTGGGGAGLMTLPQAKKHLRELYSDGCVVCIYKVVPVLKIKRK